MHEISTAPPSLPNTPHQCKPPPRPKNASPIQTWWSGRGAPFLWANTNIYQNDKKWQPPRVPPALHPPISSTPHHCEQCGQDGRPLLTGKYHAATKSGNLLPRSPRPKHASPIQTGWSDRVTRFSRANTIPQRQKMVVLPCLPPAHLPCPKNASPMQTR